MYMSNICYTCVLYESHRCRNEKNCPDGLRYEEYTGSTVRQCLCATVEIYQDGYVHCPILDYGCEECIEAFGDGSRFEPDEEQNYERKPRWRKGNGMRNCGLPKGYEDQCCLNRSGMCTLDIAEYSDINRAVVMRGCGFIGVNDRYLMWKYGVPYKDFICGNCQHYVDVGGTHGECANEQVQPHTKGIKVDGETKYTESKEYYSGAHACKYFIKKGCEEVAKKTYWTKCGRKFTKSSDADVTGYTIDETDIQCADCPFQVEVKKGWPPEHERWECRAGSKEPNHTTEWVGSLEDKNSISIYSLDNNLMEDIIEYCNKDNSDLKAAYNADHLADCRRTVSIYCSKNKKGIEAKKALIEKFFPTANAVPDDRNEQDEGCETCETCETCDYAQGCDSVNFMMCTEPEESKRVKKKQIACSNYVPNNPESCDIDDDELDGDLEDQLDYLLEDGDRKDKREEVNQVENQVENQVAKVRSLEVIEAEINFYKQQTATGIIEIGKRLIEAKEQLQHGEWGKWLEEKVEFSQNTAGQFMRAAREFSNSEALKNLGTKKLFLLLDVPAEERPAFQGAHNLEEMTSRQVEAAVKEWKAKLKKTEEDNIQILKEKMSLTDQLKSAREFGENQSKYADEHMTNRRAAEKVVEDQKSYINKLKSDLELAKKNGDPSNLKELCQKISDYQQEIDDYQEQIGSLNQHLAEKDKQLKEKPIETSAVVEAVPESIKVAMATRVLEITTSISNMSQDEIAYTKEKMDQFHVGIIESAVKNLKSILALYQECNQDEEDEKDYSQLCGACQHFNNNDVSEEDFEASRGMCKLTNDIVECDDYCKEFESI